MRRALIALMFMTAAAGCSRDAPGKPGDGQTVTAFMVDEGVIDPVPPETSRKDAGAEAAGGQEPSGVPVENQVKGSLPAFPSAEAGARMLFEAIRADDPSTASSFFFPSDAFDLLKNMATPGTYYKKLVKWYAEDIHTEHRRYHDVETLEFDGFEAGRCRWMDLYTEGNKLPYWACRYNSFYARAGDTRRRFELRVMINWGKSWHVTHLGPVRK